jgi:hypothetical protein
MARRKKSLKNHNNLINNQFLTFWLVVQCLHQLCHHILGCGSSCELHLNFSYAQTSWTKVALELELSQKS